MSLTTTSTTSGVPLPTASTLAEESPYNYVPTQWVAIIFVSLFSVSLFFHLVAMIWFRLWWLLPTVALGLAGEILGWTGRLWSSINIEAQDPYMIQISCLIIAPTPFLAAIFITFGRLVRRLGERYSLLSSRWYSRIFLSCDIVSLIVQAVGGGIASSANTTSGANLGGNIMLVGIIVQLVALSVFMLLAGHFFFNLLRDRSMHDVPASDDSTVTVMSKYTFSNRLKLLSVALVTITTLLMIRAVYRVIELAGGWTGPIISTQIWFNIFDGAMVVLAVYTLNVFHPGYLLFNQPAQSESIVMGTMEGKSLVEDIA